MEHHMATWRPTRIMTIALLLAVAPASGAGTAFAQPAGGASVEQLSSALEVTARTASPAVVEIFATSYAPGDGTVPRSADLVTTQRASGSGVIVDPDGYIVTNAHVVRGAQALRVELASAVSGRSILSPQRRSVAARIVGIDLETDLAVLKVEGRALAALPFGDSEALRAGQLVLAVGSPLGLQNSVSLGVISNVARQLEPESPMVYVQTDASINPGSSGGPLLDLRGRIVGINTLIPTQSGRYEGFAFAAPSNIVRTVYEHIRENGRVRRGDIGIRAQTLTPLLASGLGLSRDAGVILADVRPESTAERAGLRIGDIVLALDGKPMENGRQLQVGLYRRFVGEVAKLDVLRDGKMLTIPVGIVERDDPFASFSSSIDARQNQVARLGVVGVPLDGRIASMLPAVRVRGGVVVITAVSGAIDSRDGELQAGDVIYAVNRKPVITLADLRALVDAARPGQAVVLHLDRGGELLFLAFTAE
jgi:serine protease Do